MEHRLRLSDPDVDLIVAALSARLAMLRGDRAARARRLILRLQEGGTGNPNWRLSGDQTLNATQVQA